MVITHFGKQFFKVSFGDITLAFNPISKDSKDGGKTKFGSTIVFSSVNHPDYNGIENASHGGAIPFVVDGPGDYEVQDVFIKGIASETEIDGKEYINTIYVLSLEGMTICFFGALFNSDLTSEQKEAIGNPDIVFVPVSDTLLSPSKAHKLATSLEPAIIVPMDYDEKSLKAYLKESGSESVKPSDKLTVKKKDLIGKQGEVVYF
jgi:L-ascorbate metabolism protein UlaG (beta-lactamase superfamily)